MKKADFAARLRVALGAGLSTYPKPVQKVVWLAVSVSDPDGELQTDQYDDPLPDPDLRDNENVPLDEDIDDYMAREVLPHVPDAWVNCSKTSPGHS